MSDNYKELYEKERDKNREAAIRIARLEEENSSLSYRLDRIHNNPIWRHTKWIRDLMLKTGKLKTRIKNLGGLKGFLSKVAYKIREAKAKKSYGKKSFPDGQLLEAIFTIHTNLSENRTIRPRLKRGSPLHQSHNSGFSHRNCCGRCPGPELPLICSDFFSGPA